MEAEERAKVKQHIINEMDHLRAEVDRLREHTSPIEPDNAIGRLTRMEAINSRSIHEKNMGRALARLKRLAATLVRVDDEDYGYCRTCDEEIAPKRIWLVPEGTHCMKCLS